MTDPVAYYFDPPEKIRARFKQYRAIGVGMLRVEVDWRSLEREEGKWHTEDLAAYLRLVKEYGFRIKLICGVMMAPPKWFLDKHPEARIVDENGGYSTNTMSYWYPKLRELIDEKTRRLVQILGELGVSGRVDYVIPSFGPAGEPVYPVPWTLGPAFPVQTFWCYDENAQRSFRGMAWRKHRRVASANRAWGTRFWSWDEVRVLPPGTRPGVYWDDVLRWYRDSKRAFVQWQIDNTRKHFGPKTRILLYVPGTHYSQEDWAEAVRTARGNDRIMMMADSRFLVEVAARKRCWLQYTGVDNAPEAAYLRRYLDQRGYRDVGLWGENAGFWECAKDPVGLARTIIRYRYHGLDFTHAHFAFQPDGVTPNEVMPKLKEAYRMIRQASPQARRAPHIAPERMSSTRPSASSRQRAR